MNPDSLLSESFYLNDDVLTIARDLIGKKLCTEDTYGNVVSGMITETEAYKAPEDKASHAHNFKRTKRTETMYLPGGHAYVYLIYGIHHLFNVVTGPKDLPHAVLIRAVEPVSGEEIMLKRRNQKKITPKLSAGPGRLSDAMAIDMKLNRQNLRENSKGNPLVWIEHFKDFSDVEIESSPRVGINYAEEYVNKPWRYFLKDSEFVS